MKQMTYANVKVHNEIAFCSVTNIEIKNKIEREFLKNRISYYEKWENPGFFRRLFGSRSECIICINEMQKDKAEEVFQEMKINDKVEMIEKPVEKTFF